MQVVLGWQESFRLRLKMDLRCFSFWGGGGGGGGEGGKEYFGFGV